MTTGADLLARQLRAHGVDRIFSLNGGHIAPVYDACLDAGIDVIDVRHEDAAVHMAHAHARITGRPAVACLTAGPGVGNGVNAIASARAAASPIVVIGGRVPVPQFDLGALQDVDQISLLRPVTRSARTVLAPDRIPEYLAEAHRLAAIPPHSPTFIEIPTDVLRRAVVEPVALQPIPSDWPTAPSPAAVDEVVRRLRSAERPVLVAGSGVLWARAEAAVRTLAEAIGMPVLTTSLARGILPADHPLNLYAARSLLLGAADLVLVVGSRFNYVLNYGRPPRLSAEAQIIHVDASPTEVDRNRRADVAVVADARVTVELLAAALGDATPPDRPWLSEAAAAHDAAATRLRQPIADEGAVHPLELCNRIAAAAPAGTRFVVDGGDILSFARLAIHPDGPRQFLDPGPYGGLGAGVPFANAMQLADPDHPVLCITGDGALGFNTMELDTAVRHRAPIIVVVANNAAWGIERNAQIEDYGPDRIVATELRDIRFDEIARAMGCRGERVESSADIGPAINAAVAAGEPTVIDVVTARDVRSPDLARGLATVPDGSPLQWDGTR